MYSATTQGISVSVVPEYLPGRSDAEQGRHFWAYHILLENHSDRAATLRRRHWTIVDASGRLEEVEGEGVIGEQPRLEPGSRYEYSSGCPLNAQSGLMYGTYLMEDDNGTLFRIEIPAFSLDIPDRKARSN